MGRSGEGPGLEGLVGPFSLGVAMVRRRLEGVAWWDVAAAKVLGLSGQIRPDIEPRSWCGSANPTWTSAATSPMPSGRLACAIRVVGIWAFRFRGGFLFFFGGGGAP